jgi:hypothetical protein
VLRWNGLVAVGTGNLLEEMCMKEEEEEEEEKEEYCDGGLKDIPLTLGTVENRRLNRRDRSGIDMFRW